MLRRSVGKLIRIILSFQISTSKNKNIDGVLEIYLDHKFPSLQEGLNCESLAYKGLISKNKDQIRGYVKSLLLLLF